MDIDTPILAAWTSRNIVAHNKFSQLALPGNQFKAKAKSILTSVSSDMTHLIWKNDLANTSCKN